MEKKKEKKPLNSQDSMQPLSDYMINNNDISITVIERLRSCHKEDMTTSCPRQNDANFVDNEVSYDEQDLTFVVLSYGIYEARPFS